MVVRHPQFFQFLMLKHVQLGHFVPSKGNWRKFLTAYIQDPTDNVPSPSESSLSSAGNSGTATPIESDTAQLMKL
jgi:hypothetical protein